MSELDYIISEDGNSITIDAVDEAVDVVMDFVMGKLKAVGCEKRPMFQIRLAVEELFVNIISYAYAPDIGKAEVRCVIDQDPLSVTIHFIDSGKPFNPLLKEEADTSGDMFLEHEGGFGIHLVKKTMDEVDYEYRDGQNVLWIKKILG